MTKPINPSQQELPLTSAMAHTHFPGRSMLTIAEVADALKCTEQHVKNLIDGGQLVAVNIGSGDRKFQRIPVSAYDKFIVENKSI